MRKIALLAFNFCIVGAAYASCPQVTPPVAPNCSSGCSSISGGGDLIVNAGQTYCVASGEEKTVSNLIMNGGAIRVCGKLNVNEFNSNGNTAKTVDVGASGTLIINQSLNLSNAAFTNRGYVHVKGDRVQLNSSGNRFINTESATLFMNKSGGEFIVNDPNGGTNDFYNYGKSFLRKVRINGNQSDRVCLDNTSNGYKFCLMEGFHVNPNGSMGIVGNCNPAPGTNIMDVTGVCDFQNPAKLVNGLPAGLSAADFTAILYQGSSTMPANQLPGVGQVLTGGKWGDISATRVDQLINCQPQPLPIVLENFSARLEDNGDAKLSWRTASETDNDRFEVERSLDGKNFLKIDEVKGAGTTNSAKDYSYTDTNVPDAEYVYYRLKQVDRNGKVSNSVMQVIRNSSEVTNVTFANPAKIGSPLNVGLNAKMVGEQRGDVVVTLVDVSGKVVNENKLRVVKGQNNLEVQPVNKAGTYILRIQFSDGQAPVTKKVIFH